MFFGFCEGRHAPSILGMRRGIPRACLTLIYQQPMARVATASETCSSVHCAVYTSWGEAAAPHLDVPLPQVYSWLNSYNVPGSSSIHLHNSAHWASTKGIHSLASYWLCTVNEIYRQCALLQMSPSMATVRNSCQKPTLTCAYAKLL